MKGFRNQLLSFTKRGKSKNRHLSPTVNNAKLVTAADIPQRVMAGSFSEPDGPPGSSKNVSRRGDGKSGGDRQRKTSRRPSNLDDVGGGAPRKQSRKKHGTNRSRKRSNNDKKSKQKRTRPKQKGKTSRLPKPVPESETVNENTDDFEPLEYELDPPRAPAQSAALRGNFMDSLHSELFEQFKILLEATFFKQGKVFGQWNKRFFRLENDKSKPILLYWLNSNCAEFQKYNPRGALDLSMCKVVQVSPIEIEIRNALDLQKIDEKTFPVSNKCVSFKLKGGADAIKSLTDIIKNYTTSSEESSRKFAAISKKMTSFLQQYELKEELGRGGFAVVYRAIDRKTKDVVAVKQLKLSGYDDPDELQRHLKGVENEIKIMSIITKVFPDNPNLLKLRGVFHEPGERSTYIVMDLMNGGELFDRIVAKSKYTEKDAAKIFFDAMKALRLLHKVGIVHRDLKPENIIFASPDEDATLKIADFGAAYIIGREDEDIHNGKRIGSPGYFAPEVYRTKYGLAGDIWSMGVILYCMLVGYPPFDGDTEAELMMKVITCQFEFHEEHWSGISEEAKDLISSMLKLSPGDRLTVDQVLVHPWFQNVQQRKEKLRLDATVGRLRTFNSENKFQSTVTAFNTTRLRVQQGILRAVLGRAVAKAAKTKHPKPPPKPSDIEL